MFARTKVMVKCWKVFTIGRKPRSVVQCGTKYTWADALDKHEDENLHLAHAWQYVCTSHLGEAGLIPGGVALGFSHMELNPEDAAGRWGFLGDLPFSPPLHSGAAPYSSHFTLVGSQCLDAKSRPNLSPLYSLGYRFGMNNPGNVTLPFSSWLPMDISEAPAELPSQPHGIRDDYANTKLYNSWQHIALGLSVDPRRDEGFKMQIGVPIIAFRHNTQPMETASIRTHLTLRGVMRGVQGRLSVPRPGDTSVVIGQPSRSDSMQPTCPHLPATVSGNCKRPFHKDETFVDRRIVPDDATDRRIFSTIVCLPDYFIPALLHTHLIGSQDFDVLEVAAIGIEAGVQTTSKVVKGTGNDMLRDGFDSCDNVGLEFFECLRVVTDSPYIRVGEGSRVPGGDRRNTAGAQTMPRRYDMSPGRNNWRMLDLGNFCPKPHSDLRPPNNPNILLPLHEVPFPLPPSQLPHSLTWRRHLSKLRTEVVFPLVTPDHLPRATELAAATHTPRNLVTCAFDSVATDTLFLVFTVDGGNGKSPRKTRRSPTSVIAQHDSSERKYGRDPAANRTCFALVGDECASRYVTAPPPPPTHTGREMREEFGHGKRKFYDTFEAGVSKLERFSPPEFNCPMGRPPQRPAWVCELRSNERMCFMGISYISTCRAPAYASSSDTGFLDTDVCLPASYPNTRLERCCGGALVARRFGHVAHMDTDDSAPEVLVYATPVDDVSTLRNSIEAGCETIRNSPGIHQRIRVSMQWRVDACVLKCCKISWCLLTAVLTRRAQQEPVTRVEQGETECTATTHERARGRGQKQRLYGLDGSMRCKQALSRSTMSFAELRLLTLDGNAHNFMLTGSRMLIVSTKGNVQNSLLQHEHMHQPPLYVHPDALMNPWKIPDCFATYLNNGTEGVHIVHWGCIHKNRFPKFLQSDLCRQFVVNETKCKLAGNAVRSSPGRKSSAALATRPAPSPFNYVLAARAVFILSPDEQTTAPYQPPRSIDFNPLDFCLWVHLKVLVYATPVDDVNTLRNSIVAGCETIRNFPGAVAWCEESCTLQTNGNSVPTTVYFYHCITGQDRVEMPLTSQPLIAYQPAAEPIGDVSKPRSSQSDTRPVSRASRNQSASWHSHINNTLHHLTSECLPSLWGFLPRVTSLQYSREDGCSGLHPGLERRTPMFDDDALAKFGRRNCAETAGREVDKDDRESALGVPFSPSPLCFEAALSSFSSVLKNSDAEHSQNITWERRRIGNNASKAIKQEYQASVGVK
ncbi:hypothetical protein PR048_010308 [Dryococelus australis]|uniref:Uncharacterized protein n=1 Tax=Dryococelus australis TaxID=614101 RepID=A0ABQ9I3G6_9NEOP|nr:hypothetical protein PR048_010308 [Dryococelus australis]